MQRIAPNTVPPRQSDGNRNNQNTGGSPALMMGRRIRAEQGAERAQQYLAAMEPFVAPAERAHIAQQLGVQLPVRAERNKEPQPPPQGESFQPPNFGGMPNFSGMPNFGGGGMNGMPNFAGLGGGGNNLAQMMQMMNAFNAMGGGGKGKMDPMMMAQMLGSMMGKK
ncbi:MAG: hypothetical protein ABFC62_03385 [Clostridiaceae bacterium]|nr:hypothetical protein [Eubacteriales bacterium]